MVNLASRASIPASSQTAVLRRLLSYAQNAYLWMGLSAGLGIAAGLLAVAQAALLARIFREVAAAKASVGSLAPLFFIALAVVGLRGAAGWGREEAGFAAGVRVRELLRTSLLERLYALGPAYRSSRKSAELSTAVFDRVEALHGFYARYLPQLIVAAAVPLAIFLFVFPISWAAGGLLLLTAPAIPLFMVLVGMGTEAVSQKHFEALGRLGARFLDVLQGLETLKRFGRSRGRAADLAESAEQYRRRTMSVLRIAFLSSAVLEFFASIAIALVAVYLGLSYLGYLNFGLYGRGLSLENGLFILLLAPEFYAPLRDLGTHYHARAEAVGAAVEIERILKRQTAKPGRGRVPEPFSGRIRFEGVSFSYPGQANPVLEGVDLELDRGRRTFLVGGSGEGKTTLLHLLLGFLLPTDGRILADGRPLWNISPDRWRKAVSWIGQEPRLFSGTHAENIRLGKPDASAAEVSAAARQAGIFEFVERLPAGFETAVGEGGRLLSRGQAQRVALARSILADAPVLLLDEPYAGLDAETEKTVDAALDRFCRGKTVLWATHRLSTIRPEDRVLVLEAGKVREADPKELKKMNIEH